MMQINIHDYMKYIHYYNSPLGLITEASDGKKLTGLWFEGQKYYLSSLDKEYTEQDLSLFNQTDTGLIFISVGRSLDLHHLLVLTPVNLGKPYSIYC